MKSVGFVSLVLCHFRHRSVGFVSPVRSFVGDRGRQNAQNAENRRRSRAKMRTGDAKWSDLGRNVPGPATEGQQDEGRHGDRTKAGTEPARNRQKMQEMGGMLVKMIIFVV